MDWKCELISTVGILVAMMAEYTVSGCTPESGSGSGVVMTETTTPSGQSWFHTHLIIHDLYWPLVGEIDILDTTSAIKSTILIICSVLFLVGFVTLSCKGLHRIQPGRASHPFRYFLLFSLLRVATCAGRPWCLKQVFSTLNVSCSHIFCISQVNLSSVPCVCFTNVLPWAWWCFFFSSSSFVKMYLFSSTLPKPTEEFFKACVNIWKRNKNYCWLP